MGKVDQDLRNKVHPIGYLKQNCNLSEFRQASFKI